MSTNGSRFTLLAHMIATCIGGLVQIWMLHKATRLDPGTYEKQLQRAEEAADALRSQAPPPEGNPGAAWSSNAGGDQGWQQEQPSEAQTPRSPGAASNSDDPLSQGHPQLQSGCLQLSSDVIVLD